MRSFLAGVTALAVVLTTATPAMAATVTRTYSGTDAVIANPGRGFFAWTETRLRADGSGWEPLAVSGVDTVVFRIVYLEKYQAADTITAADLDLLRADLATARRAGVKLVLRFAYTSESDADATPDRTVGHIAQIGNVLAGNGDVLAAVQAGFIGRWGEWYYTRNFTRADQADRRRVLDALLAAVPATVPVQVRTPRFARRLAPGNTRVGIHNDCFLAGDDDYGTYTGDDRAWLAAQKTMLVGGETCDVSARSGWANANTEMAAYHWTYLNPSFHAGVLDSWGAAGRTEAAKRLGYRLRLVEATLPARARTGQKITIKFTITNDGYAAPVQNRPVRLLAGGRPITLTTDVRTWTPGRTVTVTGGFTAPAAGSYPLALSLPDPSPRLANTPAYAIQLANKGVWDARTGRNSLGATLTVTR